MDSLERIRKKAFQQQFLDQIQGHIINGLELHLQTILSTEGGWQWKASKELGTNPF